MDIMGVITPTALGLNVTSKVVLPPAATVALGAVVTEKSANPVPENEMAPIVKEPIPVFSMVKVFTIVPELILVEPNLVLSEVCALVSPLLIEFPFPLIFISGARVIPVPCNEKLYGFSSLSSVTIDMAAVLTPADAGVRVTSKVVFPPGATVALGALVTAKLPAFDPENEIAPIFSVTVPTLYMVYVFVIPAPTAPEPKSVQSAVVGPESPSVMDVEFPCMSISIPEFPVPCKEKLYGFSSPSSVTIDMAAVLTPAEAGVHVTTKVVFAPAVTVAAGAVVTAKSAALVPENEIAPIFNVVVPVLYIV
jgi:hypothetical protein